MRTPLDVLAGAAESDSIVPLFVHAHPDDETLAYLLEREERGEWGVTPEQVTAILEAHLTYLESVGVIGTAVPDPASVEDLEEDGPDGTAPA